MTAGQASHPYYLATPPFTIILDVTPLLHSEVERCGGSRAHPVLGGRPAAPDVHAHVRRAFTSATSGELFMNRTVLAMLAVTALSGCTTRDSATTTTPPALSGDDESAVRALVNEFANTWNRHDMKAMHELDTEDVEWINVVGHQWRGKATVYKGHVAIHKGMSANTSMSVESATIRSIAPTVAVAVATMHFGPSPDPRFSWVVAAKTRGSFTMVKRDGIWKIAHFQNTVIDPKAENDDVPKWDATGFPPPGHPLRGAELRRSIGGRRRRFPTALAGC